MYVWDVSMFGWQACVMMTGTSTLGRAGFTRQVGGACERGTVCAEAPFSEQCSVPVHTGIISYMAVEMIYTQTTFV